VHQVNAKIYAYMNPRDKMPFEVTPVYFRLQRYHAPAATSVAGAPANATPDAAAQATPQDASPQQTSASDPGAAQQPPAAADSPEHK
jgi:hypothetical protein